MDHSQRVAFDPLVSPLFEFCCQRIKGAAVHSNFPQVLDVRSTVETILVNCADPPHQGFEIWFKINLF